MSRSGMTAQERLEDISRISGMSVDVCRRVLNAETESVIKSLKKGERATLIGRATFRPELRQKLGVNQQLINVVKVKTEISSVVENAMLEINKFEESEIIKNSERTKSSQVTSLL